jgi:hypothetical protein
MDIYVLQPCVLKIQGLFQVTIETAVRVDEMRLYLWNAVTNGPGLLFISQMTYQYGEPRWNDTDREKQNNSNKSLSQCLSVHHKSHMNDRERTRASRRGACD